MTHPKTVGDRTTLAVMLALHALDFPLLVPFGENSRYDLVVDEGDRLARVQCKTGRLRREAIHFNTCSAYSHHPNPPERPQRDYGGQIDYCGMFCAETRGVYLVPIDDVSNRRTVSLRVTPPRNHQRLGIRYAGDYLVAEIGLTQAPRVRAGA